MSLASRLADELVRLHPDRAAAVVEALPTAEALSLLRGEPPGGAAEILRRTPPHRSAELLQGLGAKRGAAVLGELDLDVAARMLRRADEPRRWELLAELEPSLARSLRALLAFPENTAGALMDPDVLALPEDLTAREALARVKEAAENARYNLYVVDRDGVLVGALNLRELLLARPLVRLSALMVRDPIRLPAAADRASVVSHRGWKEVHSLPVVDERGCYLGAVRYRTLRDLEEELLATAPADGSTSEALGELFAAGAVGLLDAVTGTRGKGGRGAGG